MKRTLSVILIYCILFFASCVPGEIPKEIPQKFKSFISEGVKPLDYKEVVPYDGKERRTIPDYISGEQAIEDINMLAYLFSTAYSGYEYWKHKGIDFDSFFMGLRNDIDKSNQISTYTFERNISKILKELYDGHITIQGHAYNLAHGHKSVYFCDVLVEKTDDGQYKVIDSENEMIKEGDMFTQEKKDAFLFRTLSSPEKFQYLVGILSYDFISSLELSFDNKPLQISFHENRMLFARHNDPKEFYISKVQDIPIVRASSFSDNLYSLMTEFMESGKALQNEDRIIIDVTDNGGGSSLFPRTFIENLNGRESWEMHWGEITSPPITEYYAKFDIDSEEDISPEYRNLVRNYAVKNDDYKKTPRKSWNFSTTSRHNIPGTYDGSLIVITNRRVLSAGEALVGASVSVKNRIVIGENTGGVAQFSSSCDFYLPNSNIIAKLPRQIIFIPGLDETIGYIPDFWLDTEVPLKEVLKWIENPDSYQFDYTSSFSQMLYSLTNEIVLPKDIECIPPNDGIPEVYSRYSGRWFGVDGGVLDHYLLVERINGIDDVDAIYAWGTAPQWGVTEPGWMRFKGIFNNGRLNLSREGSNITITYEINPDGTMNSIYERPGIYAQAQLIKLKNP